MTVKRLFKVNKINKNQEIEIRYSENNILAFEGYVDEILDDATLMYSKVVNYSPITNIIEIA